MSPRWQPREITSDLLPLDVTPPTVTGVSISSEYLAIHRRALIVSGRPWVAVASDLYAVLPHEVEISYRQSAAGGPWRVTSATVIGPARGVETGVVLEAELPAHFTWGEMGRDGRPEDVPEWLGEQIERCWP